MTVVSSISHDDDIFHADSKDTACCVVIDDHILAAQANMGAVGTDALVVGGIEGTILFPVAYIVPAKVSRDNDQALGLLLECHNRWRLIATGAIVHQGHQQKLLAQANW